MIPEEIGRAAVEAARAAAVSETAGSAFDAPAGGMFDEPSGVFVTFMTYPDHDLRGCIGYPMPVFPLGEAIEHSARSACHDPRFPDLRREELEHITVEVTVLTVPHEVVCSKDELPGRIGIGRDGLIISCRGRRGLLLPQVPVVKATASACQGQ